MRVRAFCAFFAIGVCVLLARLWYLQIALGDQLWVASEHNRTRLLRELAPRGQIEDRNGKILAANRQKIVVSVTPSEIPKDDTSLLPTLAKLLNVPLADLKETIEKGKINPYTPVRVAVDLDLHTATRIEERHLDLPGVTVGPEPIRYYPHGPMFGHLMGQMGQIPPEELKARWNEGYRPGDFCGKLGFERAYDQYLHGVDGGREIEVDARGRLKRELSEIEPIPGGTTRLWIDERVQRAAWEGLGEKAKLGHPGGAVAIDPQTGAVIALASYPSYDPNLFATGIKSKDYKKLQTDPLLPQINRAIYAATAPGSTFKMITAAAGLEHGLITPSSSVHCGGGISLGGRWFKRCHKTSGHGSVRLNDAIAKSCDVYFYLLARRLGDKRLAEMARKWGLGSRTGLDIVRPNDIELESAGIVPDAEFKRARYKDEWRDGDIVDFGIGQSMLGCTAIQMANTASAMANRGVIYRPQLVKEIVGYQKDGKARAVRKFKPEVLHKLDLKPETWNLVVQGAVSVMQPGGTAYSSSIPGLTMAGKTGTAQRKSRGKMRNNAWFIGWAPVEDPKIAVCVYVQEGGHGGTDAAPIAKKMIAAYLNLKTGDEKPPVAGGGD